MLDTNLNHFKSVFVHKLFIEPADNNYFLARFCRIYGLHEEFWWQSLQAIEKYIKAGLLLNDRSVKKYSHNIYDMWCAHIEAFGDCAITALSKPENLREDFWQERSISSLIKLVERMGHPDTRYGLRSFHNSPDDIFKLDQLIFELRRRTIGLDWIVGSDWEEKELIDFYGQSYRTVLSSCRDKQIRRMVIPHGEFDGVGKNLTDVFYAWNFAFDRFESDKALPAPASAASLIGSMKNSYIYLLIEQYEDGISAEQAPKIEWLLNNIKFGKEVETQLKILLNKN